MISCFDINPLFSSYEGTGLVGSRGASSSLAGYEVWREYFYSSLDARTFLNRVEDSKADLNNPEPAIIQTSSSRTKTRKNKKRGGKKTSVSGGSLSFATDDEDPNGYLVKCKNILSSSEVLGGSDALRVSDSIAKLLGEALQCRITPRERAQVLHTLRYFNAPSLVGGSISAQGADVLAVVFEFDFGDGPTLMYASAEGFSSVYWVGGAVKSSAYEGGLSVDLSHKIINLSKDYLPSIYEELSVSGQTPSRPRQGYGRLTLITSKGHWTILLPRDKFKVGSAGIGGIYKGFVSLFSEILGPSRASSGDPLTRNSSPVPFGNLPLDQLSSRYSPLNSRIYAFALDIGFYFLFCALLTFTVSLVVGFGNVGVLMWIFYLCFLATMAPLLFAWMESSPEWNYSTIGKRVFGLKVYNVLDSQGFTFQQESGKRDLNVNQQGQEDAESGGGPSFIQSLARNTSKFFLSPLFCFTGYMWALYNPYHRAWHDLLSDTVVLTKD